MGKVRWAWLAVPMLGGCAAYPLPDDVMGYSSRDIATQVRCDARYAVQDLWLIERFKAYGKRVRYEGMDGTETAAWLLSNRENFYTLDLNQIEPKRERNAFGFYRNILISYDFSLDGTFQNDSGLSASVLGKFTSRTDTIGIDIGNTRTRQGKRQFRIFDTFESLGIKTPEGLCKNFNRVTPKSKLPDKSYTSATNRLFPSTGALRMRNLIEDFLVQNETGNLGGEKDDWKTAHMTDTMTFTTKTKGDLSPSTSFNAEGTGWTLASLGLTSKNYRLDVHTIIIDLSLSSKPSTIVTDKYGRLALPGAEPLIETGNRNLDRAKEDNFRDDFRRLSTIVTDK